MTIDTWRRGAVAAAVVALAGTATARAAVITVTNATIAAAFATANSGDTLRLVGSFGLTRLDGRTFGKALTIDATHATFTNSLLLFSDSNVAVTGGHFNIAGGSAYNRAAGIYNSSGITFTNPVIAGNATQNGIVFEHDSTISVSGGRFDNLENAIGVNSDTGGTLTGNRITHAFIDGIDIGDSHMVTATGNTCSAGNPTPGVHPDCIQLWSLDGHAIQSDITVTHNSASGPTQGFTSFATGGGGLRLTITGNRVYSTYPQGIACYGCIDSNISFNTVQTMPGAAHLTNINIVGGSGNTVIGNIVRPLPDPTAPGHLLSAGAAMAIGGVGADGGVTSVPEPGVWAMLLAGFAAIGMATRRRPRFA